MKIRSQKKELLKKTETELIDLLRSELEAQRQSIFNETGSRDSNVKSRMLRRKYIARILTTHTRLKKTT